MNWLCTALYNSVCLNNPNTENRNGKRFEMTETFSYGIGAVGFTNELSNKIELIFKKSISDQKNEFRTLLLPLL